MSSHRVPRALSAAGLGAGLALILALSPAAAATAAGLPVLTSTFDTTVRPAAKPKPAPLPAAVSWVGGKQLISAKPLLAGPAGVPAPPAPTAASWLIADLDSREVLAARRVHVPLAPASTLKIFTGLALAPLLDPGTVYTGRSDDAAVDGTKVGIVPGSTYTVDDLLHGMLMSSGNDCANALGNAVGGKTKAIALIQAEARSLGAFDTVARTTNGLDAAGQVSSAYDLALAGAAALKNPQLEKIMTTRVYNFPDAGKTRSAKRKTYQTQNHNHLLANLPGATGVKNGYTVAARGSFVGSATYHGHHYLAVIMRADGNTWRQTDKLLKWAFSYGTRATPVGTLVQPGELTAMTGPGIAAVPPAAQPSGNGSSGLRAASLPSASSSLDRTSRFSNIWLVAALAMLVLLASAVGLRPVLAGRARTRAAARARVYPPQNYPRQRDADYPFRPDPGRPRPEDRDQPPGFPSGGGRHRG
jgi:D-alanyl-D-alanine carboxypeptidase (penicillin-binding protein 5/6)